MWQVLAAAPGLAALAGCADAPPAASRTAPQPLLSFWRAFGGGFLSAPAPGLQRPPAAGAFVKLLAPTTLALRAMQLLVLDASAQSLWRLNADLGTLSAVAGAPTGPQVALALGADLSAWVLDPASRRVLRFALDGRLLQTFRVDLALPSPTALALADHGSSLLLADGMGAQWSEQRGPAGLLQTVLPVQQDGQRVRGVDALVVAQVQGREGLWMLDRWSAQVHRVQRDGRVIETMGRNELVQPEGMGVDRWGRVWVLDRQPQALKLLQSGRPPRSIPASALRVQQIGALAVDDQMLAVSDRVSAQVVLHRLGPPSEDER